ncbi:MAG: transglutaminase-like domain-containing protein [Defluviitaleaceae bacterium]|nr:transglutaminase-like domain-containing protein [Defluviitaleaceae bacterium]
MKKKLIFLLILIFILFNSRISLYGSEFVIDISRASEGVVEVKGDPKGKLVRVTIEKEATRERYVYLLSSTNQNIFPLQMGDGQYKITVLKNIVRNELMKVAAKTVYVSGLDESKLFTRSIQLIDFANSEIAIPSIHNMVAKAATDEEKVSIVYEYIINNIDYDFEMGQALPFDYHPIIDYTYVTKKGICYDYASLMAGALRSKGIPAKLQKGYSAKIPGEFHAWNEIYIGKSWFKVDTTYDRQLKLADLSVTMVKNPELFKVLREF